ACLKQSQSQPVSMTEQIAILLALSAGLFDAVPLEKISDAEAALGKATATIDKDVVDRLTSADKLSDDDHKAILDMATKALGPFQPAPDPKSPAKATS
ncbi:MAG: F0F1 ATP synthase subunit alpha, partial [Acidobacteriota bacterium]|nr:F0F1 ATP synthase subunit alpha [Acidobacteriota bacterium]